MELRIFTYENDARYVDSFLESASIAHRDKRKTKEWFDWKFRENPYGESILACAFDQNIIIGCVAIGMQNFIDAKKPISGGISFETFVHPDYQGQGLFKRLIKLVENECKKRGLQILLNFPNSISLPGFQRLGWIALDIAEYWIKGRNLLSILLNLNDIKKEFQPSCSNLATIKNDFDVNFEQQKVDSLYQEINSDFLKWRFFTFQNTEYAVFNSINSYSIGRVGRRGKLKEVQMLMVNQNNPNTFHLKNVLEAFQEKTNYDIISFPISKKNPIKKRLKQSLFLKVPNQTNCCYKILDDKLDADIANVALSAIIYHTY